MSKIPPFQPKSTDARDSSVVSKDDDPNKLGNYEKELFQSSNTSTPPGSNSNSTNINTEGKTPKHISTWRYSRQLVTLEAKQGNQTKDTNNQSKAAENPKKRHLFDADAINLLMQYNSQAQQQSIDSNNNLSISLVERQPKTMQLVDLGNDIKFRGYLRQKGEHRGTIIFPDESQYSGNITREYKIHGILIQTFPNVANIRKFDNGVEIKF